MLEYKLMVLYFKSFSCLLLMHLISLAVSAQKAPDRTQMTYEEFLEADSVVPPKLYEWSLDVLSLDTVHIKPDTLQNYFFNYNPIYRSSISNNTLGNLGSPYLSNIFFDRSKSEEFVFMDVYRDYATMPEDIRFLNTHTPYTNLTYITGGPRHQGEDELIVKHSQNFGPDFNITGVGDYVYGRGLYDQTSTKHLSVNLYASYIKPRYNLYVVASTNSLQNFESGGLTDDRYINDPYAVTDSRGIDETSTFPVELNDVISSIKNKYVNISHKYNLGYHRKIELKDTLLKEFVPVTSISHTLKYATYRRMFTEKSADAYFSDFYINKETSDSISRNILLNTVNLNLKEGLNKYVPFGLNAFIENQIITDGNNSWHHLADSSWNQSYALAQTEIDSLFLDEDAFLKARDLKNRSYSNTAIGGGLYRRQGKVLNFDALAKIYLQGYKLGDYKLAGNLSTTFSKLDSIKFWGHVDFTRSTPDYFLQHYYSNHFWWDNNFDARFEEKIEAGINFPEYFMDASLKITTINNYIYFNRLAQPEQYSAGIQVAAFNFHKAFHMGRWLWDTRLSYQLTSNDSIIPLPELSVYSNIMYSNTYAKVLKFQIGTDVRYHTSYSAQAYMPATGRFYMQDEIQIGNYPMVNVYANFHIKRMRFFLMFYHVNYGLGTREYFSSPHYAFTQRLLKVGVSWNFYD